MLKCFIISLFTITSAQAFNCGPSTVEVLVEQKVRVDQNIEIKKDWLDFPNRLSIHSGNTTSVRINPEEKTQYLVFNWVGVKKEKVKLKNGETQDFDLGKSFNKFYKKSKHLEVSVHDNKNQICLKKIKLFGGD